MISKYFLYYNHYNVNKNFQQDTNLSQSLRPYFYRELRLSKKYFYAIRATLYGR